MYIIVLTNSNYYFCCDLFKIGYVCITYCSLHSEIQWTFSDDRRAQPNSAVQSESSILNLGQSDREFRSFN